MDVKIPLCKCTKCQVILIDNKPKATSLRVRESYIPKSVLPLGENVGCPHCNSFDNVEYAYDILTLQAKNKEEALRIAPPEYLYLKSGVGKGSRGTLIKYTFIL